jgi:hypothetical protein
MRRTRDRPYWEYLLRENPWLQLPGEDRQKVRYAPIATKFLIAAK